MNHTYRSMTMTVIAGAFGLCVVACSAGVTSAQPPPSPTPAVSHTRPSPTASPTSSGSTVSVDGPLGSFPVPHGAKVVANMACAHHQVSLELDSVTPRQVSDFYTSALPHAGYQITSSFMNPGSSTGTGTSQDLVEMQFSGHGYTGIILAASDINAAGASANPSIPPLPSDVSKDVLEIELNPPGEANQFGCP